MIEIKFLIYMKI